MIFVGLFTSLVTLPLAPVRGAAWVVDQVAQEADRQLSVFYERVWREAAAQVGATVVDLGHNVLEIRRGDRWTRVRHNASAIDESRSAASRDCRFVFTDSFHSPTRVNVCDGMWSAWAAAGAMSA